MWIRVGVSLVWWWFWFAVGLVMVRVWFTGGFGLVWWFGFILFYLGVVKFGIIFQLVLIWLRFKWSPLVCVWVCLVRF